MNSRPVRPARERIKLSAVAHFTEKLFGLVGRNAEKRDTAARRTQQARHQIHQGRLACAVWPDETGDARTNLQIDAVDSEYLSIKLGDIVKDDFGRRISNFGQCELSDFGFGFRILCLSLIVLVLAHS